MPHTCVLIESDSIFILKSICMIKSDNCLFEVAQLKSAVYINLRDNRATCNLIYPQI